MSWEGASNSDRHRTVDKRAWDHGRMKGTSMTLIESPWTQQQVERANAWQAAANFHPYTCGQRSERPPHVGESELVATPDGWVCRFCDYKQGWAHSFTLNRPPPPDDHLWEDTP